MSNHTRHSQPKATSFSKQINAKLTAVFWLSLVFSFATSFFCWTLLRKPNGICSNSCLRWHVCQFLGVIFSGEKKYISFSDDFCYFSNVFFQLDSVFNWFLVFFPRSEKYSAHTTIWADINSRNSNFRWMLCLASHKRNTFKHFLTHCAIVKPKKVYTVNIAQTLHNDRNDENTRNGCVHIPFEREWAELNETELSIVLCLSCFTRSKRLN